VLLFPGSGFTRFNSFPYKAEFKINGMRKLSQDLQILSDMEIDQLDIAKIKEQRQLVARIQGTLRKKDE
jgi:hypothetical protein